ncbi:related to galactoside O-acetyltransferase [Fusarium torulosum]|uniref:Related to galactoside O-acetyltransferase n=1 Tax=Fusarium torulosum TaxID=33205 RepID=A0AAE8M7D1_9HYPO|nr:related to galactoside O-acetyltransferase [Fusarium torulosum]
MAASNKNPERISALHQSEIAVPWCDEFEKMISGMNFTANNSQELMDYKVIAMKRLRSFNDDSIPDGSTLASLKARRRAVAKEMLGQMGQCVTIEPPFFHAWGCNIFIGSRVYINREVSIHDNALVTIADGVLIGPGVCICTGTHPADMYSRREAYGTSFALPIRLEAECWIGARATILPGVTIGRGAMVAAGAVVGKDVAPETLVGGVPARFIRSLKKDEGGSK